MNAAEDRTALLEGRGSPLKILQLINFIDELDGSL